MIYRLEVENFYSIRDRQVVDLTVGGKVPDEPGRLFPTYDDSEERAPRVVAVYGPNASGKSNLLKAISFLAWFVHSSFRYDTGKQLPYRKFASDSMVESPTRISITFALPENLLDPENSPTCPYVYTLELAPRGAGPDRVILESVYHRPKGAKRFTRVLERNERGEVKGALGIGLGKERGVLEKILRPDASVIATLAQLNNKIATDFVEAAGSIISNILITRHEAETGQILELYASNTDLLGALNRDIRRIDLGVEEIKILARNGAPVAMFTHSGLEHQIEMDFESHGTQQFMRLFPLLYQTLALGGIAVIDELDAAIHPVVLPEILRWFGDERRNPNGAQLWISCHSTSLLDDLLKEEILFCEKTSDGATEVFALKDVQGIRRSENFGSKYLGGVYGAVPRIG
ncbi:AAA family ATPase [Roseovarius sp.]|uniref:AAA family ATPase n=1 Tax=Roseovarius sp. TaxID=1486281 RepID=UPI003BABAE05